nr:ORF1a [Rodent astrovirus]APA19837.1 ORF1a [Rodent astrovirus]APA19840.1 ORF1a [Rodent astrovirus]
MYVNLVDRACDAGNQRARMDLEANAFIQLDRMSETPLPWHFSAPLRHVIYPGPISQQRVIVASTVLEDEWCSYVWDGEACVWIRVPASPENQTIVLVAQALVRKDLLVRENNALRGEISDLKVKLMCLNGELARMNTCTTPPRNLRWYHWLLICILLFVLITPSFAQSDYHEPTIPSDVWVHWMTSAYGFLNTETPYVWMWMRYGWEVIALVVACVSVYRANNPASTVIYMVVATLSHLKFGLLAVLPFHTHTSMWVSILVGLLFTAMPMQAVCLAWVQFLVVIVAATALEDTYFVTYLRAHFLIPAVYTLGYGFAVMGIDPAYTGLVVVILRLMRVLQATTAPYIEVKGVDGKTVTKLPTGPGIFGNFFQKFRQLRTKMAPMVRVQPLALCRVRVPGSKGTGFFCGNYVVTAGHVVGSETAVEVVWAGHTYQTEVVRHVPGKDIVLLKIPPQCVTVPRYKVAKDPCYDWVCVLAPDGNGAYITSVTNGFGHGDTISYATPTRDGMSGAPVVDQNGHVVGVHQTNTGYTGGAQVLFLSDIETPSKQQIEVNELKAEIERLRALLPPAEEVTESSGLEQCMNDAEIVHLVRAAVGREVAVLRDELAYNQAKGKTKRGRGFRHNPRTFNRPLPTKSGRKRRRVFTEQEYKELLEAGLDPEKIKEIVDEILAREVEEAGFPEWSDPEDEDEEIEEEWYGKFDEKEDEPVPVDPGDGEQSQQQQQQPKNERRGRRRGPKNGTN